MSQVLLAVICVDTYCLITQGNSASLYATEEFSFFGRGTEGKAMILSKYTFLLSPTCTFGKTKLALWKIIPHPFQRFPLCIFGSLKTGGFV